MTKKLPVYISHIEALKILHLAPGQNSYKWLNSLSDKGFLAPNENFGKKKMYLKSEVEEVFMKIHRNEIRLRNYTVEILIN